MLASSLKYAAAAELGLTVTNTCSSFFFPVNALEMVDKPALIDAPEDDDSDFACAEESLAFFFPTTL